MDEPPDGPPCDDSMDRRPSGHGSGMPTYKVNRRAVTHCRKLIDAHHYVIRSDWSEAQPTAAEENEFLKKHSWNEYGAWYLAVNEDASDETKRRYGFVYGDLGRVHRMGLIACQYRAAEWGHKAVERAASRLLDHLDETRKHKQNKKKK
jgi:hypothetical protein